MIRSALTNGLLLSLLIASPARAIVVAYDGFNYPNSSPLLHNRAGGFGWTEGWMDNDQDYNNVLSQDDTSITSAVFPFAPIGDRLVVPHGGEVIRSMGANFNMTQDGVTFYGSLLMTKTVDGGASNDAVEFRLISNLASTDAYRVGFGSDELLFMDSGAIATSGKALTIGTPYFFVFKIVSSAAGDDQFFASAFGPADAVPATEPVTWDVSHTEAVAHIYNGVRFQTGSSVAGAEYDEIRIGNTWADVAVGGSYVLGDFNNSGGIDPGDLTNLLGGLYVGNTYGQGDIDLNGVVDLRDYNIFRPIYLGAGFAASESPAVPEPMGLSLFAAAAAGLFLVSRSRRRPLRTMGPFVRSVPLCVAIAVISSSLPKATAQVQYSFVPTSGVHDWNMNENWLGTNSANFIPDIDVAPGDKAFVGTAATAEISSATTPRVGELNIDNSTVVLKSAGKLETAVSVGSSGAVIIARTASRMEIRDNAQLKVGTVLSSVGGFHVYGPSATIHVDGDLLMSAGVLGAHITGASHSAIAADGSADLSGTLQVDITGVSPVLGTTWPLVTAAGGIERMFNQVVVSSAPALARGLQYRAVQAGNAANLVVGNSLIVTLNRQTGATSIENAVGTGFTLASYALRSAAGTLNPMGAMSLNMSGIAGTGWLGSPATNKLIAEVKPSSTFTLSAGQSVSLGSALTPGVTPVQEDMLFDFTTTDGRVLKGIVEYTGTLNDFVLYVDPSDGSAAMGNFSSFITPPNLTGYAVLSAGNQLTPGTWTTLESSGNAGAGWDASPSSAGVLTETNLNNSFTFSNGTLANLGKIFTANGVRDLSFLYTVAGETGPRTGSVVYGAIPAAGTPGDYNHDGKVSGADYVLWRKNPSAFGGPGGYTTWRQNFGNPPGSGSLLDGGAVPEPASAMFISWAAAAMAFVVRRTRRSRRSQTIDD